MSDSAAPPVVIVLVNWNGYTDTIECLETLLRLHYTNYRIVVCDNDSSDDSVPRLLAWANGEEKGPAEPSHLSHLTLSPVAKPVPCRVLDNPGRNLPFPPCPERLVIIKTGANLGFAGANNVGIRFARSQGTFDYIWFLNNDTVVAADTLDLLVAKGEETPSVGMVGATICYYYQPETVQALGGASFSKVTARSSMIGIGRKLKDLESGLVHLTDGRLDWISGASMLVSSPFIDSVGPMEEGYFLYFEELDWALRSGGRYRLAYAPGAVVYHRHGGSTGEKRQSSSAAYYRCRSRLKLYRKLLRSYLIFCMLAMVRDAVSCLMRGNGAAVRIMWRALADELGGRSVTAPGAYPCRQG